MQSYSTDLEVWHSCVFTLAGTLRNLEDIGGSHILLEEDEEWVPDLPVNYGEGLWHDEVHESTPGWREMVAGYNRAPDDEGLAASEAVGATETAPEASSDVPHSDGGKGEAETWHLQWLLERLEIEEAVGCEAKEDVDIFEGSMESTTTPEDDSTGSNMSDESDVNEGAETDNNGTIEERSEPAHNTPPRFGTPVELNDIEDLRELLLQYDAALGIDHRRLYSG
ncbi:hypothetical protein N0V95_007155 [Ascochyta clinopodiicola]|nr:hypothetical protein N0V95_007155 [Ascochyta clinopodiicola]